MHAHLLGYLAMINPVAVELLNGDSALKWQRRHGARTKMKSLTNNFFGVCDALDAFISSGKAYAGSAGAVHRFVQKHSS